MNKVDPSKLLQDKFYFIQLIRNFFTERSFIDVITPSIVQCGILPHLFSIIRVPGAHPEAVYMAAKALVYVR